MKPKFENYFCRVSPDFTYKLPSWYKNSEEAKFPWKSPSASSGFSFQPLAAKIGNYSYNDRNIFQPYELFRVIIHSPKELPYRASFHFFFERLDFITIYVQTQFEMIDQDLRSWPPEKRNCFLEGEKKLKFFNIYTKINCEHECLSEASLKACGCVPFYMIRKFS